MRPSRLRAALVLLAAVLHLGAGIASALAPCCDNVGAHAPGERTMECCLKGGPNHVCPFMSKGARKKAASSGAMAATCGFGHDQGVPAMGFPGIPPDSGSIAAPEIVSIPLHVTSQTARSATLDTAAPPPKA